MKLDFIKIDYIRTFLVLLIYLPALESNINGISAITNENKLSPSGLNIFDFILISEN